MADALLRDLIDIVGRDHVLTDDDLRAGYETDWTGRYGGPSRAVVRPADAAETAATLARCADDGIAVIPQGGNTGLVGASVPRARGDGHGTVVLSLRRMTTVGEVDVAAGQVSLGAGVTVAQWKGAARGAGLDAPVDFAARESATVGGATVTNAGGSRVVRFGTMRSQVVGLVAALVDGSLIGTLDGLPKETVGIHWPSLVCGSEGTLAVVTDVRLRVVPWYRHRAAALVAVSVEDAVTLLGIARRELPHLDTAELLLAEAMEVAAAHLGRPIPVARADAFVLLECADHEDPLADLVGVLAEAPGIVDSAVASDAPTVSRLGEFRDRMTEAISALGVPYKLDVAAPTSHLAELVALARRATTERGCRLLPFGHLAEGNVHLNVLGAPRGDGRHAAVDAATADALADDILGAVARLGGTISAEHGVGIAKARWLPLVRTPAELAAAAAVKSALDPHHILNPGVLEATALVP